MTRTGMGEHNEVLLPNNLGMEAEGKCTLLFARYCLPGSNFVLLLED